MSGSDLIGKRFCRLLIIEDLGTSRHGRRFLCQCDCGNQSRVQIAKLTSGRIKSCGCWRREQARIHGCVGNDNPKLVYRIWRGIKQRCLNKNKGGYRNYGGRGIKLCERWLVFKNFLADMGHPPSEKHSIDRINNDGNYEPGNCRLATRKEQLNNKRNNVRMTFQGRTQTMMQWAEELGVKFNTLLYRLKRGWSHEKTLSTPIGVWHR